MKVRLALALLACVVGATLIPGIATANRPEKEVFSPVGDQFICGETVLTITSGTVVGRIHVHELPSGERFRVIFVQTPRHVMATNGEDVFRVVGPGQVANFTTSDPESEEPTGDEIGFLRFKLNIIGPGGLFGRVDMFERAKKNGDVIERDRSTCELVEVDD
jgi:hypothetical protein